MKPLTTADVIEQEIRDAELRKWRTALPIYRMGNIFFASIRDGSATVEIETADLKALPAPVSTSSLCPEHHGFASSNDDTKDHR